MCDKRDEIDGVTYASCGWERFYPGSDYVFEGERSIGILCSIRPVYRKLIYHSKANSISQSGRYTVNDSISQLVHEVEGSDIWVERFNRHIESFPKDCHVKVADIFSLFNGKVNEILSADNIHPNAKGYGIIARVVAGLGGRALRDMHPTLSKSAEAPHSRICTFLSIFSQTGFCFTGIVLRSILFFFYCNLIFFHTCEIGTQKQDPPT